MSGLLNSVSRFGLSTLGNVALVAVAGSIAVCGIGLTALYLMEHVEETPAIRNLLCFVGVPRSDCPKHEEERARMQRELDDLLARTRAAEAELEALRIAGDIDTVTFFKTHDVPSGEHKVQIGTVYKRLLGKPTPHYHYCYIDLPDGSAGESRSLYIWNRFGLVEISPDAKLQAGVSDATYSFAVSVCEPFLIGKD